MALVTQLRAHASEALQQSRHDAAAFFAETLVDLAPEPEHVLLLARAYAAGNKLRRALHVLQQHKLTTGSDEARVLAGSVHVRLGEWDEAGDVLGQHAPGPACSSDTAATLLRLRGDVQYALENRSGATNQYRAALQHSVYCVEAFDRLIDLHLLSQSDERALIDSLAWDDSSQWLRLVYQARLKPYTPQPQLEAALKPLESEHGLRDAAVVLRARAEAAYVRCHFRTAHELTQSLVKRDPYQRGVLPLHLCCLVELEMHAELFHLAHTLVNADAKDALSWFAVACYYYATGRTGPARRYFNKASSLDEGFAPAWLGFAHTFAVEEESDAATAAYRNASRLFTGLHLPLLYVGMQYVAAQNLQFGQQFLREALSVCDTDPMVYNELGVVHYQNGELHKALEMFSRAITIARDDQQRISERLEPVLVNTGQTLRRLARYAQAIEMFERALQLAPRRAGTFAAMALTLHMDGQVDAAIGAYHQALALDPSDPLASDMLTLALRDPCVLTLPEQHQDVSPPPSPPLPAAAVTPVAVAVAADDTEMMLD